jgi:integrase
MSFNNKKYTHPLYSKVTLYLRPNSPFWWCSFYGKGQQFRISTKSKTTHDAEIVSGEWFVKKQAEIITGVIPHKQRNLPTIKQASIRGLDELWTFVNRGDRSKRYYDGVVMYMNKHVLPYFENMAVADVTPVVWYDFIISKYNDNPAIARNTLHQMRNALRVCLTAGLNAGWVSHIPELKIKSSGGKSKPRVWFKPDELKLFLKTLDVHVEGLQGTPQYRNGLELIDRVNFFLHSGLRVGELNNVRFKDIEFIKGKYNPIVMIRNINGKRGTGSARCNMKINGFLKSTLLRLKDENHGAVDPDTKLFKRQHREMLNVVLHKCKLKHDDFGRTRDFVSMRHTYICNKILESEMTIQEIASNCRTSSDMIYEHYAKWLESEQMDSINRGEELRIESALAYVNETEKKLEEAELVLEAQKKEIEALLSKVNPNQATKKDIVTMMEEFNLSPDDFKQLSA